MVQNAQCHHLSLGWGTGEPLCCPGEHPARTQPPAGEGHPLPPTALGGQTQTVFCLQFGTQPHLMAETPSLTPPETGSFLPAMGIL